MVPKWKWIVLVILGIHSFQVSREQIMSYLIGWYMGTDKDFNLEAKPVMEAATRKTASSENDENHHDSMHVIEPNEELNREQEDNEDMIISPEGNTVLLTYKQNGPKKITASSVERVRILHPKDKGFVVFDLKASPKYKSTKRPTFKSAKTNKSAKSYKSTKRPTFKSAKSFKSSKHPSYKQRRTLVA